MVGLNRRYSPLLRACRELVLDRGPMIQCVSAQTMHSPAPYYEGAVDILHCHGIHYLDTLRWLGGDVTDLASDVKCIGGNHESFWTAIMRQEGGCTSVFVGNWAAGGERPFTFELHGQGISVYVHMSGRTEVVIEGERVEGALSQFQPVEGQPQYWFGFREENRRFIDCLLSDEEPETSLAEATCSMQLADRIYASVL